MNVLTNLVLVEIDPVARRSLEAWAYEREGSHPPESNVNKWHGNASDLPHGVAQHLSGLRGEYAVAKASRADWEPVLKGELPAWDLVLSDGRKAQVKNNYYAPWGRFACGAKKDFLEPADVGVATMEMRIHDPGKIGIVGWISAQEFRSLHHPWDFHNLDPPRTQPAVHFRQMKPFSTLFG